MRGRAGHVLPVRAKRVGRDPFASPTPFASSSAHALLLYGRAPVEPAASAMPDSSVQNHPAASPTLAAANPVSIYDVIGTT